MAFSVNTNIAALQAQENIRVNSEFQQKTIGRVTSGLRITQSGDDAAGLAIANGLRSDQAVLTQGIRNANDGLSQLQIIDGGINNISKLLDRARTLATQSASGAFTGSRDVLSSEFSSVIQEIDRQAQAIGLDTGGTFAKSLSVFVGGGKQNGTSTAIANGSVSLDLSASTVDAKSLGLKGVQAKGVADKNLAASSATSVSAILADTTNTNSQSVAGFTEFYFRGAGFADDKAVKVSVNLTGVTDTATLVTALNAAVQNAGNGTTAEATAFKNAGIKAAIVTDANGKQQLSFSSSSSAFQVAAGDRTANGLLGNYSSNATGVDVSGTVTGAAATAAGTFGATAGNIIVRFKGSSLASPIDITLGVTASSTTVGAAITDLSSQVTNNAALQAAGIKTGSNFAAGSTLSFTNNRGEKFEVEVVGDTTNQLKLGGTWLRNGSSFDYTAITGSAAPTAGAATIEFSTAGDTKFSLSVTSSATLATAKANLNAAFTADANARAAGLVATDDGTNLIVTSSNGTAFRVNEVGANLLGFGSATTVASAASNASTLGSTTSTFNSGGATQTSLLAFSGIRLGNDDQTITVNANDASGATKSVAVVLRNDATARNGESIDDALDAINTALQQTNDSTLQKIVAVKENDSGTEKIRFLSTLGSFQVSVGTTGSATGVGSQGAVASSTVSAGGSTANIGTQDAAQTAVDALAAAISSLGSAQAVVGKGQNQFNYAINLAQSQLSNLAASESRIRDADLAAEAANLTKAQITLQAGIAALAQANSAPQAVLSLLRG